MRTLREALQSARFAITADLSMPHQESTDRLLHDADLLKGAVDSIELGGNALGGARASPLALANLLLQRGIDATPHLNCRDHNRIALQSDLLGLRAAGVSSLVLTEGLHNMASEEPAAKPVFDIHCQGLIAMANAMNEEEWPEGKHEFVIGTAAEACLPGPDWSVDELLARAKAGARFIQTRLCFDLPLMRQYVQQLVETKVTWHCSVFVTLAPLPSAENARWLVENIPGTQIPDALIKRMQDSARAHQEGIDICAEHIREIAQLPGVSGIRLLCLDHPEAVLASIEAAGL